MKAMVICNEGAPSAEMSLEQAVIYARQLEELGNYNVVVVPV